MRYNVHYTDEENAVRLMDVETVKDLLARRAYYLDGGDYAGELRNLWVQEPENRKTASYGENWGYLVGMESLEKKYAGRNAPETGWGAVHTVNTGHVHLAYDGKTARGLFYDVYERSAARPDGTAETIVVCGPLACDFIKEEGGWKIWHLVIATDLQSEAGQDYMKQKVYLPDEENPAFVEFGTPTLPMLTHNAMFNWLDNYPAPPVPYRTFDEDNSYGPEGHPDYIAEEDR